MIELTINCIYVRCDMTLENINQVLDELVETLKKDEDIVRYQQLEHQIQHNQFINTTMSRIKALQKEAVHLKAMGKTKALQQIEQQIDDLENQIQHLPITSQFQESMDEVNLFMQQLMTFIQEDITSQINYDLEER